MHHLIASYLFQHKICPLPGFGTLSIRNSSAEADFVNHHIKAPAQAIHFESRPFNTAGLLDFIAYKTGSEIYQATEALDHFCESLEEEIAQYAKTTLQGVGSFFVDNNHNMIFEQFPLPEVFQQVVDTQRVIHPEAAHAILVGDKETTNVVMTEYFSEAPEVKDHWWVWAIVLGVVALFLLLLYFTGTQDAGNLGNAIKI